MHNFTNNKHNKWINIKHSMCFIRRYEEENKYELAVILY
jgi:hypothetical protein